MTKDISRKPASQPQTSNTSVQKTPTNLKIKYNGNLIPCNMIYCYDKLLIGYKREFEIEGNVSDIDLTLEKNEITQLLTPPNLPFLPKVQPPPYSITGGRGTMKGFGTHETNGTIKLTDTLKVGDLLEVGVVGDKYVVRSKIIQMPGGA